MRTSRTWTVGVAKRYTSRKMPLSRQKSWSSRYAPSDHLSTFTATAFSPGRTSAVTSNSAGTCAPWL